MTEQDSSFSEQPVSESAPDPDPNVPVSVAIVVGIGVTGLPADVAEFSSQFLELADELAVDLAETAWAGHITILPAQEPAPTTKPVSRDEV